MFFYLSPMMLALISSFPSLSDGGVEELLPSLLSIRLFLSLGPDSSLDVSISPDVFLLRRFFPPHQHFLYESA